MIFRNLLKAIKKCARQQAFTLLSYVHQVLQSSLSLCFEESGRNYNTFSFRE